MTNEEKAREIADSYDGDPCNSDDIRTACFAMARWKDEQFSNYLKARIQRYAGSSAAQNCTLFYELNEIHQELFGELAYNTIPDYGLQH